MSRPEDNHLIETIKAVLTPIHKAGWPFIAAFAIGTAILAMISSFLGWLGLIATLWCVYFFRDPHRTVPTRAGLLVSPADGRIQTISQCVPPAGLELGDQPLTRISIFLNVFDVHVNRIPVAGTISKLLYKPGKFFNASLDKASDENEQQLITVTMADGRKVGVVQIAGLVARRIICELKEGQILQTGERFGLIRFGSRTDVYLPEGVSPLVIVGQRAIGGETVIADLNGTEAARMGETR